MKKKGLTLLVATTMLACSAIGGTLAWLTDTTEEVKNTFTTSGIDITLTETWNTDSDNDGTNDSWTAQMVPGYEYVKDPVVTVEKNSEDCYLFVKIEENNIPTGILQYTLNTTEGTTWTQLTDGDGKAVTGVYYTTVDSSTSDQEFKLLKDDKVTIKETAGNKEMQAVSGEVSLTFTAYASQYWKNQSDYFTAAEAWANLNPSTSTDAE